MIDPLVSEPSNLLARVKELEAAVEHHRQIANAERRRAAAAEESAHRAWQAAFAGREPAK